MIRKKIREAFANVFNLPQEDVEMLAYGDIPQWDSLEHIKLMIEIGRLTNYKIPHHDFPKLSSFKSIETYILSNIEPLSKKVSSDEFPKIYYGLKEVYYDTSEICLIDTKRGLFYRGKEINDLANNFSAEEVFYFLIMSKFPSPKDLKDVREIFSSSFVLDSKDIFLIENYLKFGIVNLLKVYLSTENYTISTLENYKNYSFSLLGKMAALIIGVQNRLNNQQMLKNSGSIAYNIASAFYPKDIKIATEFFNKDLIIHAEHESNASAFTARIATSAQASVNSSLSAAMDTFSGHLHGGAIDKIYDQFELLDTLDDDSLKKFAKKKWDEKKPIYGFGHRVYVDEDSRSLIYKSVIKTMKKKNIYNSSMKTADLLESYVRTISQGTLNPNVDFYCSVAYKSLAIPQEFHLPLFIISRSIGWLSHIWEQHKKNTLIRPRLHYVGFL